MKYSADVARAAYVLENYDNAYLASDKAEGYFTKDGKRAPIVIFEKKLDGYYLVVEAASDSKRAKTLLYLNILQKTG